MKPSCGTIQMRAVKQSFQVALKVISEVPALISYLQFVVKLKEAVMNQATEYYSRHLSNLWEMKM